MKFKAFTIPFIAFLFIQCSQADKIDLSGTWKYKLDEQNTGIEEQWYNQTFINIIEMPASLRDHGIGHNPTLTTKWTGSIYDSSWFFNPAMQKYRIKDSLKFPFWLTPIKHYVGAAWYQKEIDIPENWNEKTILLLLERPHWQTQVWLDTLLLGSRNSLSTPHLYEIIPKKIATGKHKLTIRVDNAIREIDPGINSHSISDHTQGNWNGMVGELSLAIKNNTYIKSIRLSPDVDAKKVGVSISINNPDLLKNARLIVTVEGLNHEHKIAPSIINLNNATSEITANISMGNAFKTWSEFSPNLYQIKARIEDGKNVLDEKPETFGMRAFTINNKHFEINGIPIFLRGTTECSVFPLTGYPPVNEADWNRIFEICKSFGLNHMRFHSYCPPEAAFSAADKAGFYLQVEGPSWAKYSVSLGDGKPIDKYLMDETKRIIDTYGNHPSFCMMAYGNEPSGHYVAYLENWVDHFRKYDPQRVFTGASTGRSWSIIENSDFIVRSPPRGLNWKNKKPESSFDYRNKTENQQRPYVTFEMGQWCVFPNFEEIEKYTGPLKARNFELFREDLNDKHMSSQAKDFLLASGKLQASCYKQEIEATLRTPNLAGFQLLSLNDFPGQGTALVGVLDAFWDEKGYISAPEFKSFCNVVVPLIRLPAYTFYNTDTLIAEIEVANFSGKLLKDIPTTWSISGKNNLLVASGSIENREIPIGNCIHLGKIITEFSQIAEANKLVLKVNVGKYTNQWNIWVYPSTNNQPEVSGVYICTELNEKAQETLESGGKVLLLAAGKVENGKDVVQYFNPAFWNTSWFRMRPPHTTGILIQDQHPVFNSFPTDYYSDLQWWELANRQQVMNLENFPPNFKPIVQPIDTWFLNRRLAMLFEAKVGNGKLMVCSININNTENKPVANQLRKSMLDYLQSDSFQPGMEINIETINELFEEKERQGWKSYVNANP